LRNIIFDIPAKNDGYSQATKGFLAQDAISAQPAKRKYRYRSQSAWLKVEDETQQEHYKIKTILKDE
jgi:hypothetical protein